MSFLSSRHRCLETDSWLVSLLLKRSEVKLSAFLGRLCHSLNLLFIPNDLIESPTKSSSLFRGKSELNVPYSNKSVSVGLLGWKSWIRFKSSTTSINADERFTKSEDRCWISWPVIYFFLPFSSALKSFDLEVINPENVFHHVVAGCWLKTSVCAGSPVQTHSKGFALILNKVKRRVT